MKDKLKNILKNTSDLDQGIICVYSASSDYTEYQMKQRVKHLSLNLSYSGYEYTSLAGRIHVEDTIINETVTAFLVMDNKDVQMLREKLLELAFYYKLSSICWIPANSLEIQTISVNDTSSVAISAPLNLESLKELAININGMRLLVSLDLNVDYPSNYFNKTNYLGKMGISSGAKSAWGNIVFKNNSNLGNNYE